MCMFDLSQEKTDVFAWNIQYPYFVLLPTFRNFAVKKGELTPSSERPLHIGLIHIGTDQKPNGRVVIRCFNQFVDSTNVVVELTRKLWLEWLNFDFARYIATKADMIEQQVYLP